MEPRKNPKDSFYFALGIYGAVGIQLAVSVVMGLYFGGLADKEWETGPWFTLIGLTLGASAGFYNFFRILNWRKKR